MNPRDTKDPFRVPREFHPSETLEQKEARYLDLVMQAERRRLKIRRLDHAKNVETEQVRVLELELNGLAKELVG